jgi:hypothetical protein
MASELLEFVDKKPERRYKSLMRIPFLYSAAAATFTIVVAVDIGIQHLAVASHDSIPAPATPVKTESAEQPIVFARFAKADSSIGLQPLQDTLHCQSDSFFPDVDLCGPLPHLTSARGLANVALAKWRLPKMPVNFIWQQQIKGDRKLVVEVIGSEGRPLNSATKSYKRGERESVQISLSANSNAENELYLVGNIYARDGKRVENWILPVAIK